MSQLLNNNTFNFLKSNLKKNSDTNKIFFTLGIVK